MFTFETTVKYFDNIWKLVVSLKFIEVNLSVYQSINTCNLHADKKNLGYISEKKLITIKCTGKLYDTLDFMNTNTPFLSNFYAAKG
jgi:hypothetical protein